MVPDVVSSADPEAVRSAETSPTGPERLSLSRELGEFLIELSIALNRTVMYPQGHPSLDDAAGAVVHHLSSLLYERSTLSIGVARTQLVIDGIATDRSNPVLHGLAARLHGHHIGAISFRQGLSPQEVLIALKLLGPEQGSDDLPLGLGDSSRLTVGPHVRLYPMTYERLEMVDDADSEEGSENDPRRGSRVASLWVGMARAALAKEDGEAVAPEHVEPAAVARAINEHQPTQAYDQVIVGYLLQIAGELKTDGSASNTAVRKHLSRMIDGLNDDALDRLLSMGGDLNQRRNFMLDAVDGMAADAVVDLARAASRASDRSLSKPLLRVFTKLATLAEDNTQVSRTNAAADMALREEIRKLVINWTGAPPSSSYVSLLNAPGLLDGAHVQANEDRDRPEPLRFLQMALELDEYSPSVDRAIDEMVGGHGIRMVLETLAAAAGSAVGAAWRRLGQRENIVRLFAVEDLEDGVLDRLFAAADPADVAAALIDAIIAGGLLPDHANALSAMTRIGPEIAEEAGRRLADQDAAIRLGMLGFLNEFQIVPPGVSPLAYCTDSDPLVRREAFKLAMVLPGEKERAIGMALTDSDPRVVRTGLRAVENSVPDSAIALLAGRVGDTDLPMDLRTAAVRALGPVRSSIARDALLRATSAGTSILGRTRLAQRSAEMLAGLAGLAATWADDPKATDVLTRARASSDSPTRAAARASS